MQRKEYAVSDFKGLAEFEIQLIDENGEPKANVNYEIVFDGGLTLKGTTDDKGIGKHKAAPDENFKITYSSKEA